MAGPTNQSNGHHSPKGLLGMQTISETDETITTSLSSTSSRSTAVSGSPGCSSRADNGMTVERKWKVEKDIAEKTNKVKSPSKLIPTVKWTATIILGSAVLCLFVLTKVSFMKLSQEFQAKTDEGEEGAEGRTQYYGLICYVILLPYALLCLRSAWMGLCTRSSPWPKKSAIFVCILVGLLEPAGLLMLGHCVIPKFGPCGGALFMANTILLSVLIGLGLTLKDGHAKIGDKIVMILALMLVLGGAGCTGYGLYKDLTPGWEEVVCLVTLNIAWLPWLNRHMNRSPEVISIVPENNQTITASMSPMATTEVYSAPPSVASSAMNSTSDSIMENQLPYPGHIQNRSRDLSDFYRKATWKASFITYSVKTLVTFILSAVLFPINTGEFYSDILNFFNTLDLSYVPSDWFYFNLIGPLVCYVLVFIACHTNVQKGCLAIPLLLSLPATIAIVGVQTPCQHIMEDGFCKKTMYFSNSLTDAMVICAATVSLTIGQVLAFGRHSFKKERIYLQKETELFWIPGYNSVVTDSNILLNRRQTIKEGRTSSTRQENKRAPKTKVYICTTMYREDESEMQQLLESLANVNEAQAESETFFESHIIFDGGVKQKKLSEFSLILISLLEDTLGIKPSACTKTITPYGLKLSWALPTSRGNNQMTFNIHLKDNSLVKNKKRWSQVMYMSYVLDFLTDSTGPDEEPYILTTDADVKFTPHSVAALLDLMSRDKSIGAVCARTHPMGGGPLVWYQIFEYAVGHWFQKTAEHVLGSVLCAPGCFSVYRCRALSDILPKYCKKVESAFDFLTKDMGEDRWLCTLMVQSGWRIEYCAASENSTNCPAEFEEFYKQRRRWIASTLANLMLIIKEWKYIALFNERISPIFLFYQGLLLFSTLIGPSTVILVVSGGLTFGWGFDSVASVVVQLIVCVLFAMACIGTAPKTHLNLAKIYTFLYAIVMCAVAVGTAEQIVSDLTSSDGSPSPVSNGTSSTTTKAPNQHISVDIPISVTTIYLAFLVSVFLLAGCLHPREITCLFHGVWYLLCLPSAYLVLMIYSICNLTDSSWGTREGQTTSTVVKKEPWHDSYKRIFYTIFFCCQPKTRQTPSVDKESQTVIQHYRKTSYSSSTEDHHRRSSTSANGEDNESVRQRSSSDVDIDLYPSLDSLERGERNDLPEQAEIEVEDVPIPVEEWLPQEFRSKYTEIFKKYGFENTLFIKELTEKELNRMGITKRGHVQYLMSQIFLVPSFEIEYKVPTNVNDWLQEIGLAQYKDNFRRNHIRSPKEMEILKRFDRKDIEKELRITKEGHIKRLLYAIRMLRDPSEVQQRAMKMRQLIEDAPIHNLRDVNVAEFEFWNKLRTLCLEPDLKAFGIEAEVKVKLVTLRNNWLMIMAVANTLWLILITTLASKAELTLLGANPIGLSFLFIFGLLFTMQFLAMLVHRLATVSHYLARASYKCGKPLKSSWSFKNKSLSSFEDSTDQMTFRQFNYHAEQALQRTQKRNRRPRPTAPTETKFSETTPLLSKTSF